MKLLRTLALALFLSILGTGFTPAFARTLRSDAQADCNQALLQSGLGALERAFTHLTDEDSKDPLIQSVFPGIEIYSYSGAPFSGLGPLYARFAAVAETKLAENGIASGTLILLPGASADWFVQTSDGHSVRILRLSRDATPVLQDLTELKRDLPRLIELALDFHLSEAQFPALTVAKSDRLAKSKAYIRATLKQAPTLTGSVFKVWEVYPGVVFFYYDTQDELTRTFLRFQEHYESPNPKFRNGIFTVEEFADWYKTTREDGRFSYYEDWAGFNFPSRVMTPFFEGKFAALTDRENALISALKPREGTKFYVIGAYVSRRGPQGSIDTILHEVAHALFFMNDEYQAKALEIVRRLPAATTQKITAHLADIGYTEQVFEDEIHAYLTANAESYAKEGFIDLNDPLERSIVDDLRKLFEAQFP